MLLFFYTTTRKRFVIFTCRYFKLSQNTNALGQSNFRNFPCSSIIGVIKLQLVTYAKQHQYPCSQPPTDLMNNRKCVSNFQANHGTYSNLGTRVVAKALARGVSSRPMDAHFWMKNKENSLNLLQFYGTTCPLDGQRSISD